jgi:predicted nucleic acid-binding protein
MTDSLWTIDTNILVYATETVVLSSKQDIAKQLLRDLYSSPHSCLAGQVVSEFMSVVIRKQAMTPEYALDAVNSFAVGIRMLGVPPEAYTQAWKLMSRQHYQARDALIIAICAEYGVKTLYSEYAGSLKQPLGVHVINPFASVESE